MKVVFFHRRPRPNNNFSVENLFRQIRLGLDNEVNWTVKVLSFYSEGFFRRLFICFEAMLHQQDINHVTGDINFISIFLRKKRTVLTILDVGFMKKPSRLARLVLKLFWIVLPVRRVQIVTTISQATKNEVLKYVNINPDKIKVIYVPILDLFKPIKKKFNKEYPVILQVGTIPNKNVMRLVEALKGIPCKLDIVGKVPPELQYQLQKNDIDFSYASNLSNEEIFEKYANADMVSFVSTYEGFGMPIVEANAVGRPVITSNLLSMPEVAGDAAHLVDPFDVQDIRNGILKIISDDEYRERLVSSGYKNCLRFDVKQIARQYTEVYKLLTHE